MPEKSISGRRLTLLRTQYLGDQHHPFQFFLDQMNLVSSEIGKLQIDHQGLSRLMIEPGTVTAQGDESNIATMSRMRGRTEGLASATIEKQSTRLDFGEKEALASGLDDDRTDDMMTLHDIGPG